MKIRTDRLSRADVDSALTSPAAVFDSPQEVVDTQELSRAEKIEILKRWELDARALQRASDENMSGGEQPLLDEVNKALAVLDPDDTTSDDFGRAPTKI